MNLDKPLERTDSRRIVMTMVDDENHAIAAIAIFDGIKGLPGIILAIISLMNQFVGIID